MACVTGTNIVNDGLVFHFDLENGAKSWKGKPTSNLAVGKTWSDAAASFVTYDVIEGPSYGTMGHLFADNAASGSITYRISIGTGTLTNSLNCNFSIYVKKYTSRYAHVGLGNGCFGGQKAITFDFDTGTIAYNGGLLNAYSENVGNGWYRVSGYLTSDTTTYNFGGYFMWLVNESVYTPGNYVPNGTYSYFTGAGYGFYFALPQFETNSTFATKYTDGVRLDTASIVDVSPTQSTITAANLTYRQDDTPTFDGTNDYLIIPSNLGLTASNFTCEAMVKFSATGDINSFFSLNYSYPSSGYLIRTSSNTLRVFSDNGSEYNLISNWNFSINTFYHITVIQLNGIASIYINGELDKSASLPNPVLNTTIESNLGRRGPPAIGAYLFGEIGYSKIYNRALTAQEVKQNFEATRARYGI